MDITVEQEQVCNHLRSLIGKEELRIRNSVPIECRCEVFIEINRAIDNTFVTNWLFGPALDHTCREATRLTLCGANKALQLFLDDWSEQPYAPWPKSKRSTQELADSIVQHCGRLGYLERLIGLFRSQLIECINFSEHLIQFRYKGKNLGVETIEKDHYHWVRNATIRNQKPYWVSFTKVKPRILKMMCPLVSPWKDHFISYKTNPEIDKYFFNIGVLTVSGFPGFDAFPAETKFGGIEFKYYLTAMTAMVGWSRMHIAFVNLLLEKCPNLDPRNLTTIFCPVDSTVSDLADSMGIDEASVQQILRVLTLDARENPKIYLIAGDAPPPFMTIAENYLLRLVSGFLGNPFAYLLESLKVRYRKDWDKAVDKREKVFRDELYRMFPDFHIFKTNRSIDIKMNGNVLTDIDAAMVNLKSGTMGLFQLKWQDLFGNSMRQRESQKRNLLETGNKWIERVSSFVKSRSKYEIGLFLGLSKKEAKMIREIRLFVIGRNTAHFSGDGEANPNAAWGIWPQLQRLTGESYDGTDPIEWLYNELKKGSPLKIILPDLEKEEIKIGDVKVLVEPPSKQTGKG